MYIFREIHNYRLLKYSQCFLIPMKKAYLRMWKSQIEIEHYSVVYFDRINYVRSAVSAEIPPRVGLIHTA